MICVKVVPGLIGTSGRSTAILNQSKRSRGPHYHVEAAVDWCKTHQFRGGDRPCSTVLARMDNTSLKFCRFV